MDDRFMNHPFLDERNNEERIDERKI